MDAEPIHDAAERFPRTHKDSLPLPTDSMVTVPLSETDGPPQHDDDRVSLAVKQPEITVEDESDSSSRPNSLEIVRAFGRPTTSSPALDSPTISLPDDSPLTPVSGTRSRSDSSGSNQSAHVDWAELEKKEEQVPQEEGQDEVSLWADVYDAFGY